MPASFSGKPSITLTGFMFTGKSCTGRALADRLGLNFIDLDQEIVRRHGCPIEEIFALEGEEAFRKTEREVVAEWMPRPGHVFAAGGGAVLDPDNRNLMRFHSFVVWLKASPRTIRQRLRNSKGPPRPLLKKKDPDQEIKRLLAERREFYGQCDLSVRTDRLSPSEVAAKICRSLGKGADKPGA